MTLPEHIMVAGHRITVELVDEFEDDPDALGEYDGVVHTIRLHSALTDNPRRLQSVLVHEAVHCALEMAGLTHVGGGPLSRKVEEQVVTVVENLVAPAIKSIHKLGEQSI